MGNNLQEGMRGKCASTMVSYDRLVEIAFGASFIANFLVSLAVFGYLARTKTKKTRDINSPIYLAGLMLGFLGGILGDTLVALLAEYREQAALSWFWPWIFIEILAGTAIIAVILYFLLRGRLEEE
jgi:H+/Cl- antiporter ClcA